MKHKKFIDELKGLGVMLVDGTNHYKAYYNGANSGGPTSGAGILQAVYGADKKATRN